MCLIAVAPAGVNKYDEKFLKGIRNGAITNKDGYGFACKYHESGVVFYNKGFSDVEELIKNIKDLDLKEEDELIVHCRTGNKGHQTADFNCHPFVISDKQLEIIDLSGVTDKPVMFHNGTFFKYSETGSEFSDTYHFIKQFMCIPEFVELLKRDARLFTNIFNDKISYNKLAFLFTERNMILIGDFIEDNGYHYSNIGYKDKNYHDCGGTRRYLNMRNNTHEVKPVQKDLFDEVMKSNLLSAKNPYGIPINSYTVHDIYLMRANDAQEQEYFMFDSRDNFNIEDSYFWLYEVPKEVIDGSMNFDDIKLKTGTTYYRSELETKFTILPLTENIDMYSDFATIILKKFNESKKAMKKLSKCFLGAKDNAKVKIKGISHPVNRRAVLLYLKANSGLLKSTAQQDFEEKENIKGTAFEETEMQEMGRNLYN